MFYVQRTMFLFLQMVTLLKLDKVPKTRILCQLPLNEFHVSSRRILVLKSFGHVPQQRSHADEYVKLQKEVWDCVLSVHPYLNPGQNFSNQRTICVASSIRS